MLSPTVGVDVIAVSRIEHALERFGERFLTRIYTREEAAWCRGRVNELAGRFAAKEATMKALGTGVRGVGWRDIEVLPNRRGKPLLYLHGRAKTRSADIGLSSIDVTLTHDGGLAIAIVVGLREGGSAADMNDDPWKLRERMIARLQKQGLLT